MRETVTTAINKSRLTTVRLTPCSNNNACPKSRQPKLADAGVPDNGSRATSSGIGSTARSPAKNSPAIAQASQVNSETGSGDDAPTFDLDMMARSNRGPRNPKLTIKFVIPAITAPLTKNRAELADTAATKHARPARSLRQETTAIVAANPHPAGRRRRSCPERRPAGNQRITTGDGYRLRIAANTTSRYGNS